MRSNVVFPAPFGPSRPVRPGPNEQVTAETATFNPNHFETSVTVTVASSTMAGSRATSHLLSIPERRDDSGDDGNAEHDRQRHPRRPADIDSDETARRAVEDPISHHVGMLEEGEQGGEFAEPFSRGPIRRCRGRYRSTRT